MKFARYLVLGLLLGAAIAPETLAQRHPMPGSKTEPLVVCTACPGTNSSGQNNDGLPTYPYSGVLVDHVGRYVDSSNTGSFQNLGYRTARARFIRPAPPRASLPARMYIQIGNGIATYTTDTFFSTKLPAGMVPINTFVSGIMGFPRTPPESVLKWEGLIYPEGPTSNWQPTGQDIQDPMGKGSPIDFDDRGYVYSAHTIHGWGVVTDNGRTDGSQLTKVMQWIAGPKPGYSNVKADTSGVSPDSVVVMKLSSTQYRALVADRSSTWAVYDVSGETPSSWRMLSKSPNADAKYGIRKAERDEANKRVAYIDGGHDLHIYEYSAIVDAGAPITEVLDSTGFVEIAFDEASNLWAAEKNGTIWKFTKSGNGYTTTKYQPFPGRFEPLIMHAAAGYMAVGGIDYAAGTYDVHLLRMDSTGLKLLDLDNFFRKYYHQSPAGYATPPAYMSIQAQSADVKIVKSGGDTYLMYSGFGIGDVFKLEAGNAINITVKNSYGTVNPKSQGGGPFYGDPVTFIANSSSANVAYDVNWVFGNPEVGTTNNSGKSRTGEEETHQYGGLTTAGLINQAKLVRAQTVQDPNIQAQLNLTLKLPTPRVGATSLTTPLEASVSGLEFVAGERFHDASDGSIESHYGVWTVDTTVEKLNPLGSVSVGGIGAHTLQFQAVYGPYDGTFNNTTPYNAPTLTVGYTVKPFKITVDTGSAAGSNTKFQATSRVTQETGIITATNWKVNWTLNGNPYPATAAGGVGTNAEQTLPISQGIPPLEIPTSLLKDGDEVGLTVTIDPAGLSDAAKPFNVGSASTILSKPDPLIEVTGCENAGSPCKFTAKSVLNKSQVGWTYLWTLTRPGGLSSLTGTAATFEPTLTVGGPYVITLKTTKTIFAVTVDKNLSVGASLCGALPAAHTVGLNASCFTNCPAGTPIDFSPTYQGYARQTCDQYLWNFGDGSSANTEVASHTYANQNTYTVTLTISNPGTTTPVVKTRQIVVGGGVVDPGPTCTKPAIASIVYSGTPSGCATGANCRTTDTIGFQARRGTQGLQTCDTVLWEFGDGTTSTSRTPSKTFSNAGTYPVKLTITNSNGSVDTTQNVTIVLPPVGNCNTAPQPANFVITFLGAQSNCAETNGVGCSSGESIRFEAINYFYVLGSCDNFSWDFGDGTAKSTERTPTHVFAGSQTSYPVKLTVSNGAGGYTYSRTVTFANSAPTKPVPTISYSVFPTTGRKGQAVTFTATSTLATTTGWSWNFGDGTAANNSQASVVSQTSTITYTFTKAGPFTVRATARNSEDAATAPTNTAQAQIVISEAPAIPEYKFLLPVTAYTAGQGGSAWRTDVQIYHSDPQVSEAKPLSMDILFKGNTYPLNMIKSTHVFEDFLGNLLGHQKEDQGPVIITTKNSMLPPQIWTRTYTQTANGTFGQYIPAIRIDNLGGGAAAGDVRYHMSGLRHDDRYRTNVGFLNPNAATITATVTVYDDRHFEISSFPLTLQPFQLDQFPLKSKVGDALPDDAPFGIEITVPPGQWLVGYASFIDGRSNDPVYIQALPETDVASVDYKTNVIPGVGHTGQWRSDVTIFNPDSKGVMFDLQYFTNGGEKKGEALNVPLDPGKFLQYSDVLKQGVLGNVEDGLGTLKLTVKTTHEKYPMTFARTYFDDGANGTYGQGIPGFSAARANVKPGKHAIIAGVRNSTEYKTNIGLVNLSNAVVTATVTLLDPTTGAAVSPIQYQLQPNQSLVGNYNGWGSISQGTFKIEANGNVWAFCSIVDQKTKDPEYVAAIPIP